MKGDQGIKLMPEPAFGGRILKQVMETTDSYRVCQLEFLTAYTIGRLPATWELQRSLPPHIRVKDKANCDETDLIHVLVSSGPSHFMRKTFHHFGQCNLWLSVKRRSQGWKKSTYYFATMIIPIRMKLKFIYFFFSKGRLRFSEYLMLSLVQYTKGEFGSKYYSFPNRENSVQRE